MMLLTYIVLVDYYCRVRKKDYSRRQVSPGRCFSQVVQQRSRPRWLPLMRHVEREKSSGAWCNVILVLRLRGIFLVSLAFVRSFSMAVRKNSRYGRTELQNIRRDCSRPFTQVQPTRSTQAHLLNTLQFSRCCHLLLPSNNKHINVSSVGAPSSPMACLEEFTAFCTIVIPTRLWSAMIDLPPGIEY